MSYFGNIPIADDEFVSFETADEYNIVTGNRSSQFLGRKARAAKLRLVFNGLTAKVKLKRWKDAASLGTTRGLGLGKTGGDLEGIFGIQKIDTVYSKVINGNITRLIVDVNMLEDASQKVR